MYVARFVWDERKAKSNLAKHRVTFENATRVFDDPLAFSVQNRILRGEERWITIGTIDGIVVLVVVNTIYEEQGEEVIRIISARKATPREKRIYAAQCEGFA
jgi:uncharacterized DUF497 family protein